MQPSASRPDPIDAKVRIGHVHLKVADIGRALGFYCDVLGFRITQRYGDSAAFIAAGDYHHHIALNTWESKNGSPPPPGSTGLYHTAVLYPTRASLADALRRVKAAGIELDGAADHGVSEALYLRDPDDNGVELYWDKPRRLWPKNAGGELQMYTRRLDLASLLAEAEAAPGPGSQRMRLQALSRWENEGGSLSEPEGPGPNPEERAICNEYKD
jgi:catechol 2,3-dioxygenase